MSCIRRQNADRFCPDAIPPTTNPIITHHHTPRKFYSSLKLPILFSQRLFLKVRCSTTELRTRYPVE
jgi:hypothetical protein